MVALIKALQVILALSLLIIVHEFGHFMWARIFKIRVEKFYLFFDAGGKALAKWRWGETEFGIGWIPFGGYCKIAGMVDESMDLEHLKKAPEPWEFRSKPAWKRLFVMAGGVLNNFILAVLIYCLIAGIWGEAYISNRNAHIAPNELAQEMGFRLGDHIISFDGYEPENFGMLQADLARRNVSTARLLRGTDTLDLYIDHAYMGDVLNSAGMFDLAVPFTVDSMMTGANYRALMHGDRVIALAGRPVSYLQDARPVMAEFKGSTVDATVIRGADTLAVPIQIDSLGTGVALHIGLSDRGLPDDAGYRKAAVHGIGVRSRRHQAHGRDHQRLCARPRSAVPAFLRRLQVRGQFHRHRAGIPGCMGLVPLPEHTRAAFGDAGNNEPAADSGA